MKWGDRKKMGAITPRVAAWLALVGAGLVIITAPLAALADTPFSPGGWKALPPYAAAMHDRLRPAFEFADPQWVLRLWEAPLALGFALIAAGAWPLGRWAHAADRLVGLLVYAATALLAALALGTGFEAALGTDFPGTVLYFIATPLAPAVACAAGVVALRRHALPRASAWALTAAPLAMVASATLLPQFPAGTGLGLALAWAAAVLAGRSWMFHHVGP